MLRKLHGKSNGKFLIIDHVLITSFIALRIGCVGWVGIMYGLGMGKIWVCFRGLESVWTLIFLNGAECFWMAIFARGEKQNDCGVGLMN